MVRHGAHKAARKTLTKEQREKRNEYARAYRARKREEAGPRDARECASGRRNAETGRCVPQKRVYKPLTQAQKDSRRMAAERRRRDGTARPRKALTLAQKDARNAAAKARRARNKGPRKVRDCKHGPRYANGKCPTKAQEARAIMQMKTGARDPDPRRR